MVGKEKRMESYMDIRQKEGVFIIGACVLRCFTVTKVRK